MRSPLHPCAALALVAMTPCAAQQLQDRYLSASKGWEGLLDRGDGAAVRKAAEAMIARDATQIDPSDYNGLRTLVALHDIAARAAILDGSWEDGVEHLRQAQATAMRNCQQADTTLGQSIETHESHLAKCRVVVTQIEQKLKEWAEAPGLPQQEIEARDRAKQSLEQHKLSMTHSEKALADIRSVISQLKEVQEAYAKSLASWESFLQQEKQERAKAPSAAAYVSEKLEQVKADDAKPKSERLSYGRRLWKLDPSNGDCERFVNSLLGIEPPPDPAPSPAQPKPKGRKRK